MVFRALKRAGRFFRERPLVLMRANLAFSAAMLVPAAAWALAGLLKPSRPWLLALTAANALFAWLAFNALAFAIRAGMESRSLSLREALAAWKKSRLLERSLAFAALGAAFFWLRLAASFYAAAKEGIPAAHFAWLACQALTVFLALAAFLNLALASREEAKGRAEWKAAALMALAFGPQAGLGFLLALLFSGGAALLVGLDTVPGRVLWIPVLMAPLFGAGLLLAFAVALSDEFLAKSLGQPSPSN